MACTRLRFLVCVAAVVLIVPPPAPAFDTPLSDTAVRQAYFMGQRHDESLARFLDSYTKQLPPPKSGPYISAVSFLTPYALLTQYASWQAYGYSAQQAELDHRGQVETVKIMVVIRLTDTYGTVMRNPTGRTSGSPTDYAIRLSGFWKDFQVQVFDQDPEKPHSYISYFGEPDYVCDDGGCSLVGATIQLEILADAFFSDRAIVEIDPPEGDQVKVSFDLTSLR